MYDVRRTSPPETPQWRRGASGLHSINTAVFHQSDTQIMMNALLSLTVMQHHTHQHLCMRVLRWMCGTLLLILQVWLLDSCASARSREFALQPENDTATTSATVYVTGTKSIDSLSAQELSKIFINVWKVETNDFPREIRVFARVMDSTGNFITGMAEPYYTGEGDYRRLWSSLKEIFRTDTVTVDEFSIREFGDKDSLQYDIGLVLDHGGSMSGAITMLQEAAQLFVGLRYPDDRIAVLKFDSKIRVETPLTKDSAALARSLQKHGLKDFGLYTALYDAIKAGILELATTATALPVTTATTTARQTHHSTHHSKQSSYSTHATLHLISATEEAIPKALVIFTDGEDNFSTCDDAELYTLAKKHNVHLFPVGFGYVNDEVLSNLATFTGGHYYKVYSKRELAAVFQDIYKSLRNFYKITYKPTPREGLRDIEIALNDLVELGYGRNPKRRRDNGDSAFAVNDSLARLALAVLNDNTLNTTLNTTLSSTNAHQQNSNPNDVSTNSAGIDSNTNSGASDANPSGANMRNSKNVSSRNKNSVGSGGTNTRNGGLHSNNDSNPNSKPSATADKSGKENKNSPYASSGRGNSKNASGKSNKSERGNSSNSSGNSNDSANGKNANGNDGNGSTNASGNDGNGSRNDGSRNNSNSSSDSNDSANGKNANGNDGNGSTNTSGDDGNGSKNAISRNNSNDSANGKNANGNDGNGSTNTNGNDGNGSKNDGSGGGNTTGHDSSNSDRSGKNTSSSNSNTPGNGSGNGSNFDRDGNGRRTNRIAVRVPVDVPMFKPVDSLNTVFTKLILFDFRKAELRPEALPLLDELAATLVKFSRIKLEVCGHTDNTGAEEFNQVLSEMRAAAVVRALVERGVRAERLRWRGFGFSQPLVPNDTEEQRQQNRRTEFRIIAR